VEFFPCFAKACCLTSKDARMYKKLNIKEWAVEDRPREKLMLKGVRSLSDAELLAILINSGTSEETAVELSRRILSSVSNDLNELGKLQSGDLEKFKGMGDAKSLKIIAAMEIGRRRKENGNPAKTIITQSSSAAAVFRPIMEDIEHEEFWILLLSRSNAVIDKFLVSQGGLTATVIDLRIILKKALEKLSTAMILCHNHPSGNMKPSPEDMKVTRKIKDAAKMMDIAVLDHIIIAHNRYFSFADEGLL